MTDALALFSTRAHETLARDIATSLGVPLGNAEVLEFPNENLFVRIGESVRGRDVFVVAPFCRPLHRSIMELLVMTDALRRASAERITAVIPYYAYGRSDKKDQPRVPITARLLADLLATAGVGRVLTLDLHAGQIQGFFSCPVDELSAVGLLAARARELEPADSVVVTDLGFAKRGRDFAERLGLPLAVLAKRRRLDGTPEVLDVIGEVAGRHAIIVDDEIDTAGTLTGAMTSLAWAGAPSASAYATHGILSAPGPERIVASGLARLVVTDSVPLPELPMLAAVSVAPLFAAAIGRIHDGRSVGELFEDPPRRG